MSAGSSYEELMALLRARHSCRAFQAKAVAETDIRAIVSAAQRVPSWCNAQPWQVEVTRGAGTDRFREALRREAEQGQAQPDLEWPRSYEGVYQERRQTCGYQLYEAAGIARDDRVARAAQMMRNFDLFDAPHVAIVHSPAILGAYGALDCGGFVTAFTLAAQACGVASIPQAAVASFAPFLHRYFGIGDDRLVLCAISFGYSAEDPVNGFRTERAAPEDVIGWHD